MKKTITVMTIALLSLLNVAISRADEPSQDTPGSFTVQGSADCHPWTDIDLFKTARDSADQIANDSCSSGNAQRVSDYFGSKLVGGPRCIVFASYQCI